MSNIPTIKLNTGASIPAIDSEKWFATAFQAGYRHIDTAQIYRTEPYVGAAVRTSGLPRGDIFVTTKLPWHHTKDIARSFDDSLHNLGLDYVDLVRTAYWGYDGPADFEELLTKLNVLDTPTFNETWAEMEKLPTSRARAIGVSKFSIKTLEQLLKTAKVVPAVNQVEMHPYLAQTELLEYCRKKGIAVTAYSPSGREKVRSDPTIVALAAKYGVSPTQIILAWHVARGVSAVPKSAHPERQKENVNLPALSAEDVASVTALDRNERIVSKLGPDGKLYGWTAEQYGWN
ncbi:NADP-dependent oxidoreductase domain-containing protein [Mycena rosella]|uniref:NADP-dependent oxidoreductase domain-containing protein n=1 Tax=Mycena rosella TaxID=1033263 RepID=A0AAD7H0K9_MYCRO|nr:NADP-dependent oxidoreductase domain-containing protein [Mycena rosella]